MNNYQKRQPFEIFRQKSKAIHSKPSAKEMRRPPVTTKVQALQLVEAKNLMKLGADHDARSSGHRWLIKPIREPFLTDKIGPFLFWPTELIQPVSNVLFKSYQTEICRIEFQ